jgi:hypothetical protein
LIQARAIPISRIDILLDALIEATHLAVDIQLKVLQILPTFFQIYGEFINDQLVAKMLLICSMLQAPSKIPVVINTAAATQQQIVLSLFDKIVEEDKTEVPKEYEVVVDDENLEKVSASSYDAYRIFADLCSLIEHQKASFLQIDVLSESFGFELLENVLTNYQNLFLSHVELGFLIRTRLTPLLLRSFSNHKYFSIVVRVSRVIILLIRSLLPILEIEAEVILSLLTHAVTSESRLPLWKKVLALEIFKTIFSDFRLTKTIFESYDYGEDKKKVITEFFTVCSGILDESWAKKLLNTNEIVTVPSQDLALTAANSSVRIPYIDLLDKADAPPPPKTYTLFLILSCTNNLCDGIGQDVLEISKKDGNTFVFLTTDNAESPNDISKLKFLIRSNAKSLVTIGTEFLYSSLGSDLFHPLIRSLQKFCHAAGVLGLTNERDSLLLLFSIATISNVVKGEIRHSSMSEAIAGTVTEAMNAISPSRETMTKRSKLPQRYLNSRHVICFRALMSLTVSLGSNLKQSWRFILITFQWFDYFINGPSSYLSLIEAPQKPDLPSGDLKLIESSLSKLYDSTQKYEQDAYQELIQQLVGLSRDAILDDVTSGEPILDDEFVVCGYNRDFFIQKMGILSKLNASRYLQASSEDWQLLSSILSDIVTTDKATPELRVIACSIFNSSITEIASLGFSHDVSINKADLEKKLFQSFSEVVDKMLRSQSMEYVSTAESEIIHVTLRTLNELLDRYGTHFSDSWEIILRVIDSPFAYFKKTKIANSQKLLLKSSFEIVQLVLNDFLQAIPLKTMKDVIDVLEKFCTQGFDLNISFSAVSYYLLLSDHLRGIVGKERELQFEVESRGDLIQLIASNDSNYVVIHCLWLYSLGSLVSVSNDTRLDVKNVAVQTFFRIVDSHGSYLDWGKTFKIVIKRMLDGDIAVPELNDSDMKKAFIDSNVITIKGITELSCRFLLRLQNEVYLNDLLGYYNKYIQLDIPPLSELTYKSFHQVCEVVSNSSEESFSLLFRFWSSQPVRYVSSDLDLYQNNLIELIKCFQTLYNMRSLNRDQCELSLSIFNNAIRFPFLPKYTSDIERATELQGAVLDSLRLMEAEKNSDIIISCLLSVVLLPYQTRSRIVKKLQTVHRNDVPSFLSASTEGLDLLKEKLSNIDNFKELVDNKCVSKIFKGLIEAVTYKSNDIEHSSRILSTGVWKKSLALLSWLSNTIAPLLSTSENGSDTWSWLVQTLLLTLPGNNGDRDESFNLGIYESLRAVTLQNVEQDSLTSEMLGMLVRSTLDSSLLYEKNDLETFLLESSDSPSATTESFLALSVEDYSTAPIKKLSQSRFRLLCLKDMFDYCDSGVPDKLGSVALPYLLCRVVMIIKRYCGSVRLLNNAPVSIIQQRELSACLEGLYELLKGMKNEDRGASLTKIFPLILDNHQLLGKLHHSDVLLSGITAEFYKIANKL